MMFRSTFAERGSVARPGAGDGGSQPPAVVIVWSAASLPLPPPEPLLELLLPPPQPAATSAATATRRAASTIELRVRIWWSSLPHGRPGRRPFCQHFEKKVAIRRVLKTSFPTRNARYLAILYK